MAFKVLQNVRLSETTVCKLIVGTLRVGRSILNHKETTLKLKSKSKSKRGVRTVSKSHISLKYQRYTTVTSPQQQTFTEFSIPQISF